MITAPARTVALFFVASPLHYLAARTVARHFEADSRCIVVPYRPGARQFVRKEDWDAVAYAPWPRFDPLPGAFGRHRRLLANLKDVALSLLPARSFAPSLPHAGHGSGMKSRLSTKLSNSWPQAHS